MKKILRKVVDIDYYGNSKIVLKLECGHGKAYNMASWLINRKPPELCLCRVCMFLQENSRISAKVR